MWNSVGERNTLSVTRTLGKHVRALCDGIRGLCACRGSGLGLGLGLRVVIYADPRVNPPFFCAESKYFDESNIILGGNLLTTYCLSNTEITL